MISPTSRSWLLASVVILTGPIAPHPGRASPIYTQDTNLSTYTSTVSNYATFITGSVSTPIGTSYSMPYTPTGTILLAPSYPRMVASNGAAIIAQFGTATAQILVFNNIDHIGRGWDAYQYAIYGSNDNSSYTLLFDPSSVNEADNVGVAIPFTIGSYVGTAPVFVNNTITAGAGSSVGSIGYEAYFDFGVNSYSYYKLLQSTLTLTAPTGENEIEISAIAQATPPTVEAVPEPASIALFATALAGLIGVHAAQSRRRVIRRIR